MDPAEALAQLGGAARADQLLRSCTPRELARAVRERRVLRPARGRYQLPHLQTAGAHANRLSGTVVGLSAALEHGWEVARPPDLPWVAVPRNRNVSVQQRRGVRLFWSDDPSSSPVPTVIECARRLPFGEALAVADSALRHGVDPDELVLAAAGARGQGAPACRRVAAEATALAANPFESMLRAIALDVPGLRVRPQVPVTVFDVTIHPDLVDLDLGIVVEADGWLHHASTPDQFARDLWRYTALVVHGWLVVRFGYHQVMHDPAFVREALEMLVRTGSSARHRLRIA
jgi:very-short-patch-repair endonuclease